MNEKELESMRNSFKTVLENRKNILNNPRIHELQEKVIKIRQESIENCNNLIEIAKKSFDRNDIDYVFAKDKNDANNIILNIIKENENFKKKSNQNDSRIIAKSKSNTLGEIAISKFLTSQGMEVVETDLGDRILQLKSSDNKPIHPTGPATHLNVEEITKIINESMGEDIPADAKAIMETVREDVLNKIHKSKIGISGANVVASEDGSIVLIHNEGNISLISLMKIHIVVVGIDKFVKNLEEAISIAKLETIYATGSEISSYINIVSGPSKTADIEKKLIKNMYGAEKVYVIILDNGRSEAMEAVGDCLLCLGCGSCIISCPVYNVIGNEFGFNNFLGGRGIAMSRFIEDMKTSYDSGLYKCTLCGLCTINCPVSIQTNEIIEEIREDSIKKGFYHKEHGKIKSNIKNKGSPY